MPLPAGARFGSYEILAPLGEGGMGAVYRARDTKLGREVAIKVLLPAVADDADRLARFQREAQVLASLNHPHIAAIYGLEDADGTKALVLELVEGPTLAERIEGLRTEGSGLPIDEALAIAKQIAEALEAAHEQGIIHRDLKPANIKVRPDGTVKVLDFGLAKAMDPAGGSSANAMLSPTISMNATQAGAILGTAAYMSPEQAAGKPVDKRSDLWAFGVVLLEMLTGRQVFGGETVSHVLAAVLKDDPDWTSLPANTPAPIRKLLRRCLEKDRKKRLDSAAAARLEIDDAIAAPANDTSLPSAPIQTSSRSARLAWLIAATAILAAAALAVPVMRHVRESLPLETRVDIVTPATSDPLSFALSPDGRQIAVVASGDDGVSRLWLRSLTSTTAQPLAGTDGASFPFWSPDSRSLGFFAGGHLKRLDIGGGPTRTVTAAAAGRGGTWNAEGVILFATSSAGPLSRIAASGGNPVPVTLLESQSSHRFPSFLPDGRHFLFYAQGGPQSGGIHLGSLDSHTAKKLTAADTAGVYLPSGWLLCVREGTLMAQQLDLTLQALIGDPINLAETVAFDGSIASGAVSVSASGLVAYRAGGAANRRQLTWFDRTGKVLGTMGSPDENGLSGISLSADSQRGAVVRTVQSNADIWLIDSSRTSRFTFDASLDQFPIWSPDGRRIAFRSNRTGAYNLYVKPASGASAEALLVESSQSKTPSDWSADGRFLMYLSRDPQTDFDLWVRPMEGDQKPWVFLNSPFTEKWGRFSPDGRWVAYMSNESGQIEVYVRAFARPPASGSTASMTSGQWQVSTTGGAFPAWRADGRALYYLAPTAAMMEAPMTMSGAAPAPGTPVLLFPTHVYGGGTDTGQGRQYDVAPDGRFLINTVLNDAAATPITLIQNWRPDGKK